jgi:hypothetical protein
VKDIGVILKKINPDKKNFGLTSKQISFCRLDNMISHGTFGEVDILNNIVSNLLTCLIQNFSKGFLEEIISLKFGIIFED